MNTDNLQQKHWRLFFLLAWAFALHFPFIYVNGAGEGDTFVLVNGIIHAINRQDFLNNPLLVFNFYSFGYYWLIFKLQPLFAPTLTSLFSLVNTLGFIFSVLTTIPLYLFLKDLKGERIAFYSLLVYPLAPTIFEISTYGHPVSLAWFFITITLYLFQKAILEDKQAKSNYLLLGVTICTALAMCFRADVLLLAPFLVGLLYYHNCLNKKAMLRLGLSLLGSIVLFSLLQFMATGVSWGVFSIETFFVDINKFHTTSNFMSRLARGLGVLALTVGPIALLLAFIACFYLYKKERRLFILLLLWLVPILIFWLPFPTPSRHFLYAIPGIILLAVCLMEGFWGKYLPLIVSVFLVLNYYSPLLIYPSVVASRPQVGLPEGQKQVSFSVPLLPAIENHFYLQKEIDSYRHKAKAIIRLKNKSLVIVDNFVLLVINAIITSGDEYSWEGRSCGGKYMSNLVSTPNNEYFLVCVPNGQQVQNVTDDFQQKTDFTPYYYLFFPQTLKQYPNLQVPEGYKSLTVPEAEL